MMNTFKLLALFLIYFCNLQFSFSEEFSYFEFRHISTDSGLSQKTAQIIHQDSRGFVWVGTQEGLNRYDGQRILQFTRKSGDIRSISSNVIRDILEDTKNNIWVATSSGLNRFNAATNDFQRVEIVDAQQKPVMRLNTLFQDDNGDILVGTDGNGIYKINVNSLQSPVVFMNSLEQLKSADVRVIFKDSRGRKWIGTDGNGLWLLNDNDQLLYNFTVNEENPRSLSHNRIRSVIEDSNGQIWIGTRGGGLNKYNELNKEFLRFKHDKSNPTSLSNDRVYQILEDSNRTLWVATAEGVNLYRPQSNDFLRVMHQPSQPSGLSHNRVLSLLEDQGGLIWIGTLSGLNIWNPTTAKFVHHRTISEDAHTLSNNSIYGVAESNNGDIYATTLGGGLNFLDNSTGKWNTVSKGSERVLDKRLITLMIDSAENIWVGSFSKGVTKLSKEHQFIENFESDKENSKSLSANGITDILQDSEGEIWIATYSAGLNRLISSKDQSFKHYRKVTTGDGLLSDSVLQILEDDEGYIWLATDGGGISRLDKNSGDIFTFRHSANDDKSLTSDTAWSIYQDSKGRFWIGTQGRGLNRFEPEDRRQLKNNFKRYTVNMGLPSSTVNGVLEDADGFIWISTNKGVSRLDPDTDEFHHYNLTSLIHKNELNLGAMLKAKNGRLFFGGINGITAFNPKDIKQNTHVPTIMLTNIFSENNTFDLKQSLQSLESIYFTHRDYLITFEFAALDYSEPEKNRYKYKLEGFDPDWVDGNNFNRATYTNLPSGQYLLKVKGSNNDGLWSEESINLQVNILPAPWATWWAFMIYSILFCGFLILLIRTQASRIANQDLFKKQVLKEIDNSTQALELENELIKKKLKNFEINSANDFETGLPNQTFFTEQVLISLAYLEKFKNQNSSIRLVCLIIKTDCNEKNQNQVITELAENLTDDPAINLVARWNKSELAVLSFSSSMNEVKKLIKSIKDKTTSHQNKNVSLSVGYTVNPLNNLDNNAYKWENVLMLTEHTVRTVSDNLELDSLGLLVSHQPLTPGVIRAAMSEQGLASLNENFETLTK